MRNQGRGSWCFYLVALVCGASILIGGASGVSTALAEHPRMHPQRVIVFEPQHVGISAVRRIRGFERNPGLDVKKLDSGSFRVRPVLRTLAAVATEHPASIPVTRRHNPCLKDRRLRRLVRNSGLQCEPDFLVEPSLTPNDTRYSELWGMNGANGIGAPTAWDVSSGAGIVVAVIDTGVERTHSDLAANMWTNTGEIPSNGIDDDANGYVDDVYGWDFLDDDNDPSDTEGHGTHVAGTIAAVGNNSLGVIGAAYGAKVMALRFIGPSGGYTSDAISAINYAVAKNVRISNNSWGGGGSSISLKNAIDAAGAAGMLFVAAAGNDGEDTDSSPHYPSAYTSSTLISVGSIASNGSVSYFSNFGATSVDLFAPGSSILSTVPSNAYAVYDGTSMATPHVAGVAAQILAVNPGLSVAQLKDLLLNTTTSSVSYSGKCLTSGRLNAAAAVQVIGTPAPTSTPTSVPTATSTPSVTATPTPTATPSVAPSDPPETPAPTASPTPTVSPAPDDGIPDDDEPEDPGSYALFMSSGEAEDTIIPGRVAGIEVLAATPSERVRLLFERDIPGTESEASVRCGRTGRFRVDQEDASATLSARVTRLARYLPGLTVSILDASSNSVASLDVSVDGSIAHLVSPRRANILGNRACRSIVSSLRLRIFSRRR